MSVSRIEASAAVVIEAEAVRASHLAPVIAAAETSAIVNNSLKLAMQDVLDQHDPWNALLRVAAWLQCMEEISEKRVARGARLCGETRSPDTTS